jgi:hypothetical protein
MTLGEIIEEMYRKPDAHSLVEWIGSGLSAEPQTAREDISAAIGAYYAGLEAA